MKNKEERSKWLERIIRYGPLVFWAGVILYFSSTSVGSSTVTSRFIRPLLEFLFPSASSETIAIYHGYVRKAGHFTGYAILGFFALRAFLSGVFARWKSVAIALVVCLAVAVTDEFIQSFSPERTGSLYDVALDMFGATFSVVIALRWLGRGQD